MRSREEVEREQHRLRILEGTPGDIPGISPTPTVPTQRLESEAHDIEIRRMLRALLFFTRWYHGEDRGARGVEVTVRALTKELDTAGVTDAVDWRVVHTRDRRLGTVSDDVTAREQRVELSSDMERDETADGSVRRGGLVLVRDVERRLSVEQGTTRVWVQAGNDLRKRVCVLAHGGHNGHRGVKVTCQRIGMRQARECQLRAVCMNRCQCRCYTLQVNLDGVLGCNAVTP